MPGYKKRAKHKSTTSKKHKKPKRVLRSTNEEKMVESCSDSGESYASDETVLKENDVIAIIPPVSGG